MAAESHQQQQWQLGGRDVRGESKKFCCVHLIFQHVIPTYLVEKYDDYVRCGNSGSDNSGRNSNRINSRMVNISSRSGNGVTWVEKAVAIGSWGSSP